MLNKYAKYLIIGIIQLAGLGLLMLLIAPNLLKNTSSLHQWQDFFTRFQLVFFLSHSLFYIALYYSCPRICKCLANRQPEPTTVKQIKHAMQARYYLISTFLLFELLNLLR